MKDKYGIIGYPLGHSASQTFFNKKFTEEGIDAEYFKYQIPDISEFPAIIKANPELKGMNVTIPYKEKVIAYLDDLDEDTRQIGAVNVIKFIREGERLTLKGFNSDLVGFQNSIKPLIEPQHTHALVLGTGGASKAVRQALKNLGIEYRFVSRTKSDDSVFTYDELDKNIIEKYKLIVNTSPLGTYPDVGNCPAIPYEYLTSDHLLYDLVYNPSLTKFLELGQKRGAQIKNGKEMLVLQAVAAWNIWSD